MLQTLRLPLAVAVESRTNSTAKDSRMVNAFQETLADVQYVIKRPGTTAMTFTPTIANGTGQGITAFNGKLYAGINSVFYEITTGGATTNKGAIAAGTL